MQEFDGSRHGDFNLLPERRLIIHLSGEVETGASDGAKRVLRAGDIRLMEDVAGKGPFAQRPDPIGRGLRPAERLIDRRTRNYVAMAGMSRSRTRLANWATS